MSKGIFKSTGLFFSSKSFLFLWFVFYSPHSTAQHIICFGDVKKYGVDRSENLGLGSLGSVYNWRIRDSRFAGKIVYPYADRTNEISIDWGNTSAGDYLLEVNEVNNGCKSIDQILIVTVLPPPVVNFTNQNLCIDPQTNQIITPVLIDTKLSSEEYSFKWERDGLPLSYSDSSIRVDKTGNYSAEVISLLTGCRAVDSVIIGQSSPASASVKVEGVFADIQNIIITVVKGIGDYEYSIDRETFQSAPVFAVSKPGVYKVVVRDKKGCADLYLTANVIMYPKFFTPNSDGYNDVWKIDALLPSMNPRISIFDRYGKMLKNINVIDQGWDGSYNGNAMPSDDYWFSIEYINEQGVQSVFKSHFTLKR